MGTRISELLPSVAQRIGLSQSVSVGIGLIDAHAGGIGVLGTKINQEEPTPETLSRRLALICGTSTCHMAVKSEPTFIKGIWGPYWSSMVEDMWLTEGGQSATGKLLDFVVESHPHYLTLKNNTKDTSEVYDILLQHLKQMVNVDSLETQVSKLSNDFHVYPDFHGNRSPLANPQLKGMISGLTLNSDLDNLSYPICV